MFGAGQFSPAVVNWFDPQVYAGGWFDKEFIPTGVIPPTPVVDEVLFGGVAHFRKLHERSLRNQEALDNLTDKAIIAKSDSVTEIKLPKVYRKAARPIAIKKDVVIDAANLKSEIRDELIKQYMISLQAQRDTDEAMFMMMLMLA